MIPQATKISPILIGAALGVVGCASARVPQGFQSVQKTVEQRTGQRMEYPHPEMPSTEEATRTLLQDGLTPEKSLQIAFLNNPGLKATLEELGIAEADRVQAGLIQNPVLEAHRRYPKDGGGTNSEFQVTQNILNLLSLPLNRKVAKAQYEQARFRVGNAVLALTEEIRSAFYRAQSATQVVALRRAVVDTAEAGAELAERQYKAGTRNRLERAQEQALYREAQLELTRAEADLAEEREKFSVLLGIKDLKDWKIAGQLLEPPAAEPSLEALESLAASQRLDLAILREEPRTLERGLWINRVYFIPELNIGISTEKEVDGPRVTGPMLESEIPLFDRRQAARSRIKAQWRQSRYLLAAFERQVSAEVRLAHNRLQTSRQAVEQYHDHLIPLRQEILEEELKHYNYMLRSVFELLLARQNQVNAQRDYLNALRDYWIARAELERAVGGKLPEALLTEPKRVKPTPEPAPPEPIPDSQGGHPHHAH